MKKLLTKKLINVVWNIKSKRVSYSKEYQTVYAFMKDGSVRYDDVYAFSFDVKEWLDKKGYIFASDNKGYSILKKMSNDNIKKMWEDGTYTPINEVKSIFKAGNFVLKLENETNT